MVTGVDPAFWAGRRVLLTGHTGFKGSWLSLWLSAMGAQTFGCALAPHTRPCLFDAAGVANDVDHAISDVRDPAAVAAIVAEADPDIIIHMAAQPLVRKSYAAPLETYSTNVMGTAHVLEAARRARSLRAVVVVTTDKCYANRNWLWGYREDEALGGHDPYSSSKAATELVAAAYRDSFFPPMRYADHGVALATARAGNVIGGGDWSDDRLIPDCIRSFQDGQPVVLRNPDAVRPWQHVLEPLCGYLLLAQRLASDGPAFGGAWNFGPDMSDERTVAEVVSGLVALWGDGAGWRRDHDDEHPPEDGILKLDSAKARARLPWRPRWRLDQALQAVISWHRAFAYGGDARALTLNQIHAYAPETVVGPAQPQPQPFRSVT